MESRAIKIQSSVSKDANIRVIPGHFATNHSHVNYYVDMTVMKSRKSEAAAAAKVLARKYTTSTFIDTIICMDGCEVIGAYLAEYLTESGILSMNQHQTMYVVSPEMHPGGQLIFRDNSQFMIQGKNCLLLLASATTGRTIERAMECISYYGGNLVGISALFSAGEKVNGVEINRLFGVDTIPNYESYEAANCPMCAQKRKIDAIINSYGYSRL